MLNNKRSGLFSRIYRRSVTAAGIEAGPTPTATRTAVPLQGMSSPWPRQSTLEGSDRRSLATNNSRNTSHLLLATEQGKCALGPPDDLRVLPWTEAALGAVKSALTDRQGRIWIGGERGLLCHGTSGTQVTPCGTGIPDATISSIFEDTHGRVWIGSWGDGIAVLSEDGCWRRLGCEDGLCFDDVNGIAQDKSGRIWVATDCGVSILDGERFVDDELVRELRDRNVKSITSDACGRIYLGIIGALLIVTPERADRVQITTDEGLPQRTPQAVRVDRQQRVWVGTWGGGAVQIDSEHGRVLTQGACSQGGPVGSFCEAADGTLWMSSLESGLWRLGQSGWKRTSTPIGFEDLRLVASIPEEAAAHLVGDAAG